MVHLSACAHGQRLSLMFTGHKARSLTKHVKSSLMFDCFGFIADPVRVVLFQRSYTLIVEALDFNNDTASESEYKKYFIQHFVLVVSTSFCPLSFTLSISSAPLLHSLYLFSARRTLDFTPNVLTGVCGRKKRKAACARGLQKHCVKGGGGPSRL